jgi:hypothetical protein
MPVSISVQVTIPEVLINSDVVRLKIENTLKRKTGPELKRLFEKTTEGWDTDVKFYEKYANTTSYVSVTVFTRSKIYGIVNFGSPPHPITPKRPGGMLRFQTGYRAGTRPKVIGSRSKQRSGPYISTRAVNHPGFEAREFDLAIAEEIAKTFPDDVQEAIRIGSSIF